MKPFSLSPRRRGTVLAGVLSLAVISTRLLSGAGNVPVENFSPQGPMQSDLNAGGHSITNASTVSTANLVVNGTAITSGGTGPQGPAGPAGPQGPSGATAANVTGIRKSSGASTTDVAAGQADITALISGLYPLISNNLSDLANPLTAAQNLGVSGAQVIPESASFTASTRGALYNVTTGTSALTVTLPTAANGFYFVVRKADNSTGTVAINGATLGVMGHTMEVYCDGTSFMNRYVAGAIDAGGNFTYTLPANANYNIVPSGSGRFLLGGLPPAILDANGNLPFDAHTINLDNRTIVVDGSSIESGHGLADPYAQGFVYLWSQMHYVKNHVRTVTTTATGSSGAFTLTLGSTAGLAVGMQITGTNIPAGAMIGSINPSTNVVTYNTAEGTAGISNTGPVSGNATFSTFYNFAAAGAASGDASFTNSGNCLYSRYSTLVYPHRPTATAASPAGTGTVTGDSNVTLTFSNSADVANLAVGGSVYFNGVARTIATIPTSTTATVTQSLAGVNPSSASFTIGGDGGVAPIYIPSASVAYNDSSNLGRTPAQSIADLDSITAKAMTDGFVVCPISCELTGNGANLILYTDAVNTALMAGSPNAVAGSIRYNGMIIDESNLSPDNSDFTAGGTVAPAFQADGIHPTAGTDFVMAVNMENAFISDGSALKRQPYAFREAKFMGPVTAQSSLLVTNGPTTTSSSSTTASSITGGSSNAVVLNVTGSNTQASEFTVTNTTTGGHSMAICETGSANSAGAGALVFYDNTSGKSFQFTASGLFENMSGSIAADALGSGLQVKEGTNAKQGIATLVNGTVTVSNTTVTANSRIQLTGGSLNSSTALGVLGVPTITSGTSFVITSYVPGGTTTQSGDLRTVNYEIFEPAP